MRIFMLVGDLHEVKNVWSEEKFFENFGIAMLCPGQDLKKLPQFVCKQSGYQKHDPHQDKPYLIQPFSDIVLEKRQEN